MISRLCATTGVIALAATAGIAPPAVADSGPPGAELAGLPNTLSQARYYGPDKAKGMLDLKDVATSKIPGDSPIVVSLGDSYISGEAGRWAGNVMATVDAWRTNALGSSAYSDAGADEAIPDCHRATQAEVNFALKGVTTVNLACSGAVTGSQWYPATGLWKPGIDFAKTSLPGNVTGYGQALMLQNLAAANPGRIRMVELSIGGNDFNFGPIVTACVTNFIMGDQPCSKDPNVTKYVGEENAAVQLAKIQGAMRNVVQAVGTNKNQPWTLMAQDYPSPVATSDKIRVKSEGRYTRLIENGCPMYNADLDWANLTALIKIDDTVRKAASGLTDLPGNVSVKFLDLTDALVGHRLCEQNTYPLDNQDSPIGSWDLPNAVNSAEWVQAIRVMGAKLGEWAIFPFRTQESLHPDYWAQRAYQSCQAQAYGDGTAIRGGTCLLGGPGLDPNGRPIMKLASPSMSQFSLVGKPGAFGSAGGPGKVVDLGVAKVNKKAAMVDWRKPTVRAKAALYYYRVRKPHKEWGPWMSVGRSTGFMLTTPKKGTYSVKVVATNAKGAGEPQIVAYARGG